jgi:hypothetical protein
MAAEYQRVINNEALDQIKSLRDNPAAFSQVKALSQQSLRQFRNWLEKSLKTTTDSSQKAHINATLAGVNRPAVSGKSADLPPGSPIGCGH